MCGRPGIRGANSYWAADWASFVESNLVQTIGYAVVSMESYLWVAIGSALGGVARYWCSGVAARLFGETFPWGTVIVNIVGSFVIGFFATLTGPDGRVYASSIVRQFVMIGICGGYTTFSSFSLQTLNLMNDGEWLRAGGNVVVSVVCCMVAVWIGHVMASGLGALKWT
jgi:CrcB protein